VLLQRLALSRIRETRLCIVCCVSLCFFFVSGAAHILCLTVASGWNKERCIPEMLPLLCHKNFCSVLDAYHYNSRIRYFILLKFFFISASICSNLALDKFSFYILYGNIQNFSSNPNLKPRAIFSQGLHTFLYFSHNY
jgi:hypothetical protein